MFQTKTEEDPGSQTALSIAKITVLYCTGLRTRQQASLCSQYEWLHRLHPDLDSHATVPRLVEQGWRYGAVLSEREMDDED